MSYTALNPEENTFTTLVADLTHRCNMKCANCYIPNRTIPDMDTEKLYAFLERLPRKTFIRLIGAEPTLRDDLPEIVRSVILRGHRPSVTTNGLRLADEALVRSLKEAGLKYVCLSMNGADDDGVYQVLDNGKYAERKTKALFHLFKYRMMVAVGCIIARDVNEDTINRLVDLVVATAEKAGMRFDERYMPTIRFKSVGMIGRNMGQELAYSFDELANLVSARLGVDRSEMEPCMAGSNTPVSHLRRHSERWRENSRLESLLFDYPTRLGPLSIRLIDWTVDGQGVVNSGNRNRGRITKDWMIAPFFEDVKVNEFGY